MNWTPPRRSLMLHVIETGGWLACDPSQRGVVQTLLVLERDGCLTVDRDADGRPVSATATTEGVRRFLEYWGAA